MLANCTIKVPRVRLHKESTPYNQLIVQPNFRDHSSPHRECFASSKVLANSVKKPYDPCVVEMEKPGNCPLPVTIFRFKSKLWRYQKLTVKVPPVNLRVSSCALGR